MQTGKIEFTEPAINSRLSLRPLVDSLKKAIEEGKPGARSLYGDMIERIEAIPVLLAPISDVSVLKPHIELVEMLLSTIFPPTNTESENLYAVALPFTFKTIYTSRLFQMLFLKPGSTDINVPDDEIGRNLSVEKLQFAYAMILKKFANYPSPEWARSVHPYLDPVTGTTRYMELQIDARFIDVNPKEEMPVLPENVVCQRTNKVMSLEDLRQNIPIDEFIFEGISIVRVIDVTEQEIISRMKNSLLSINSITETAVYRDLQYYMQSLVGLKDIRIGLTPFFKVNGHYVYSELHNSNSLLFQHFRETYETDEVAETCKQILAETEGAIVFETLDEKTMEEVEYLKYYYDGGGRSLLICPLKQEGELIGILEIVAHEPGMLKSSHINLIAPAIPLFTLALGKSAEALDTQIDKVIKEKFTAVQPAVEWKFTEAAFHYILGKQDNEEVKMDRIVFDEVYPLYGSIDIRNSSTERAHAIQLDLIEQLRLSKAIIKKAQSEIHFPLLLEIEYKIDKFILAASDTLLSEDELRIHEFLQHEMVDVFEHLSGTEPALQKSIADYFGMLDPAMKMIYHHRREYETSIARINDTIVRFIDKEQVEAQKAFPHYFERYVTDGVEFNAYIGQSIAPRKKFDSLYLRNMKMWQLMTLARASRMTNKLAGELVHPLYTTQLILAHSVPISISFRSTERKFDVDGAYNIRYEIIKKRIDKVRIKETMERLTQPGKVAIVYSQPKEAMEYKEYIEFLQDMKLLKPGVEEFDLEELQGVVGLKALRVDVNFDEESKAVSAGNIELSKVTSRQLIGK